MSNDLALAVEQVQFLTALDSLVTYHNTVRARIAVLAQTGEKKMAGFDWMSLVIRALTNVPLIVAGIEHIHGDAKSGLEKKQLAMEALGLATAVAPQLDPADQATIQAASALASSTIDGVVSVMNAATKPSGIAAAPKMPVAAVSQPNAGLQPPVPISPLAPQPQAAPAGSSPKAPSSLDSSAPQGDSLWP